MLVARELLAHRLGKTPCTAALHADAREDIYRDALILEDAIQPDDLIMYCTAALRLGFLPQQCPWKGSF
jgi:hypothetical protein